MLLDACTFLTDDSLCDRDLFIYKGKKVSFKSFRDDVASYASYFETNIRYNEVVLYITGNIYLFYVCFFALLHARKNVVLPTFLGDGNISDVNSNGNIFVTDATLAKDGITIINPAECNLYVGSQLKPIGKRTVTFFTAGTTEHPKRIKKTFNSLVSEIGSIYFFQKKYTKMEATVVASVMPNHLYGIAWRFLFPLCTGLLQDLDTIDSPEKILKKQQEYKYILLVTTPSFMDSVVEYNSQYLYARNCLAIYSSGSLMSKKTATAVYDAFGVYPFEIFGSTETGGVAYRDQKEDDEWHVFPTVEVTVNKDSCLEVNSDFTSENPLIMHDVVTMTEPKRFILHGRLDRMVKIAEIRVSMPEMENHLIEFPLIKKAYVLPQVSNDRTVLGAVITLNEEGIAFFKDKGKRKLVADIKDYLSDWFEKTVMPKKFRIFNAIPVNERGKIVDGVIAELFDSMYMEPLFENIVWKRDSFSARLTFLDDAPYFKGHFPDDPMLPASIQIYFAMYFLQRFYDRNTDKCEIKDVEFNEAIMPMQTVDFTMSSTSENEWLFTYGFEDRICSTGIILLG